MTPIRSLANSMRNYQHVGIYCDCSSANGFELGLKTNRVHARNYELKFAKIFMRRQLRQQSTSRPFLFQLELAQTERWWRRAVVGYRSSFSVFLAMCTRSARLEEYWWREREVCWQSLKSSSKFWTSSTMGKCRFGILAAKRATRGWSFDHGCNERCAPTQWRWKARPTVFSIQAPSCPAVLRRRTTSVVLQCVRDFSALPLTPCPHPQVGEGSAMAHVFQQHKAT